MTRLMRSPAIIAESFGPDPLVFMLLRGHCGRGPLPRSRPIIEVSLGRAHRVHPKLSHMCPVRTLKSWSGRRGSNRRRPAWEHAWELFVSNLCINGVHPDHRHAWFFGLIVRKARYRSKRSNELRRHPATSVAARFLRSTWGAGSVPVFTRGERWNVHFLEVYASLVHDKNEVWNPQVRS